MKPTEDVPTVKGSPLFVQPGEALSQPEDLRVLQAVEEYLAAREAGHAPSDKRSWPGIRTSRR